VEKDCLFAGGKSTCPVLELDSLTRFLTPKEDSPFPQSFTKYIVCPSDCEQGASETNVESMELTDVSL
jgi:hypothetical protein